jgi:membrane protein implicated in regulation of membrane protease activity
MQSEDLVGLALVALLCTAVAITFIVLAIAQHATLSSGSEISLFSGAALFILFAIVAGVSVIIKCRQRHR